MTNTKCSTTKKNNIKQIYILYIWQPLQQLVIYSKIQESKLNLHTTGQPLQITEMSELHIAKFRELHNTYISHYNNSSKIQNPKF